MRKKIKIFTHVNVDIDAVASIWFFLKFILQKKIEDVNLKFVPANWDGIGMEEGDVALDIHAGGRGIKGLSRKTATGKETSSAIFCLANSREVAGYKVHFDPVKDPEIAFFIEALDLHDSTGKVVFNRSLLSEERKMLNSFYALISTLFDYKISNKDYEVVQKMIENLDNKFSRIKKEKKASPEKRIKNIIKIGDVAIKIGNEDIHSSFFFEKGFKVVVYESENNLGAVISEGPLRSDPEFYQVIKDLILEVGEKIGPGDNWNFNENGHLVCRGSRKSPANSKSKLDAITIARALATYMGKA